LGHLLGCHSVERKVGVFGDGSPTDEFTLDQTDLAVGLVEFGGVHWLAGEEVLV